MSLGFRPENNGIPNSIAESKHPFFALIERIGKVFLIFFTKEVFRVLVLSVGFVCVVVSVYFTFQWFQERYAAFLAFLLSVVWVASISISYIFMLRLKVHKKNWLFWGFIWISVTLFSMFSTLFSIYNQNTKLKNYIVEEVQEETANMEILQIYDTQIQEYKTQLSLLTNSLAQISNKNSWQAVSLRNKIDKIQEKMQGILDAKNNFILSNKTVLGGLQKNAKRTDTGFEFISKNLFFGLISPERLEIIISVIVAIFIDVVGPAMIYAGFFQFDIISGITHQGENVMAGQSSTGKSGRRSRKRKTDFVPNRQDNLVQKIVHFVKSKTEGIGKDKEISTPMVEQTVPLVVKEKVPEVTLSTQEVSTSMDLDDTQLVKKAREIFSQSKVLRQLMAQKFETLQVAEKAILLKAFVDVLYKFSNNPEKLASLRVLKELFGQSNMLVMYHILKNIRIKNIPIFYARGGRGGNIANFPREEVRKYIAENIKEWQKFDPTSSSVYVEPQKLGQSVGVLQDTTMEETLFEKAKY